MTTVIIGGVAGGASAAARLRRLDEKADIIMLEKGGYISFANCGLPYYVGGVISDEEALEVQTPESFKARFNVDVRVFSEVTAVEPGKKKVRVKPAEGSEYELAYDKLIVSTGSKPFVPEGTDPESCTRVFFLRTIPDAVNVRQFALRSKAKSAIIAGGGFIGLEAAENLKKLGIEVTVIEMSDKLVPQFDSDMAAIAHRRLREEGVKILTRRKITGISESESSVKALFEGGSAEADMLLMCLGSVPETALMRRAGIKTSNRGAIVTDKNMRTSDPDIYAVGDAVQVERFGFGAPAYVPLAGPANKQGRIAADNIFGIKSEYGGAQGSSVISLFGLTLASTGINEHMAKELGIEYKKFYNYSANHATYYPGAGFITLKTLFDESGKLIGAQLAGDSGTDKRADVLAAAIRGGFTYKDLAALELCYAPPYSSAKDPVNYAGYTAENVYSGLVKQFFPEDVERLKKTGAAFLDVRTKAEFVRGHIEGAVNLPIDSLRDNIEALPKGTPLYVNCQSGLRSYIACRILTGLGIDCFNLAGGYRLYEIIESDKNRA